MAILLEDDFEVGNFSKWSQSGGHYPPIIATQHYKSPTHSALFAGMTSSGKSSWLHADIVNIHNVNVRFYWKYLNSNVSPNYCTFMEVGYSVALCFNFQTKKMFLTEYIEDGFVPIAESQPLNISPDTQHCFEVEKAGLILNVYLEGIIVFSGTLQADELVGNIFLHNDTYAGWYGVSGANSAPPVYIDDVVIAESYIGPIADEDSFISAKNLTTINLNPLIYYTQQPNYKQANGKAMPIVMLPDGSIGLIIAPFAPQNRLLLCLGRNT
jgi:hypothetical protein